MKKATKLLFFLFSVGLALVPHSQVRAEDAEPANRVEGHVSLYIWSDALQSQSISSIIEFAQAQGVDRLVLSVGKNSPMEKVKSLKARARQSGLTTEFLLAPNYWVRSGDLEDVRSRIRGIDLEGSPLHLNIEPHAYDDFDEREEEYLRRYLEVLRETRKIIGDARLAVSIPLFWPDSTYRKIAQIVDQAYFMAYGEKKPRKRARQTHEVARHFSSEQRVVALRPEDYSGPSALNQDISTVEDVVGTEQFALHDFESLSQFVSDHTDLPVELVSFGGTASDRSIRLTWQTASEAGNAGFEVRRRRADDWTQVGYVESKAPGGTTTETQSYSYTVTGLPVGSHQFRLRQVDLDGSSTLTDPVSIEVQMQEAVTLNAPAPNPMSTSATLSFAVRKRVKTRILLYNTLGQRVATVYEGTPQAGEEKTAWIDATDLPSGSYFLRLSANGQTRTQRITVVR